MTRTTTGTLAVLALGLSSIAVAETTVQTGKADRQTPAGPHFSPSQPTLADASAHADVSALTDAFGLFGETASTPAIDRGTWLRTASLEPVSLQATPAVTPQKPGALGLATKKPLDPSIEALAVLPVPKAKPPVPKVKVASLAPVDEAVVPQKPQALDAAPILGEPRKMPGGASPYLNIFRREAKAHNIPLWLALGVAWVESKFDPKLRGTHTVVGMMQVMPSTAREMGYRGTTNQLFDPETNIIWGMNELAKDYKLANGDICLTIAKYKGGFYTKRINKGAWNYCSQVKAVTGMP